MRRSTNAELLARRAALVTRPSLFGDRAPYLGINLAAGGAWFWGLAIARQGIWLSAGYGTGGLELFELPGDVDAEALPEWLATPAVGSLRARIVAGETREWDGREHVGHYSDDASQACDALRELARDTAPTLEGSVYVWDARDWLLHDEEPHEVRRRYRMATRTSDARLEAIATTLQDEAARHSQVIDRDDLLAVLRTLRDDHPRRG